MNLDKIFDDIVETIKTPKEEVQPEPKKDLMTDMVQECFSQHEASSNKYKCECGTIVPKLVFENEVGQVGDVFNVMSPRSIAQAINNCLQNENTYRQRALELAKVRLNWEIQEEKLLKAVDLALSNNINT